MNISPSLSTTSCLPVSPSYFSPPLSSPSQTLLHISLSFSSLSSSPSYLPSLHSHATPPLSASIFLRSSSPTISNPLPLLHDPFILHSSPTHILQSAPSSSHIPLSFNSGIVRGRWRQEGIKMTIPEGSNNPPFQPPSSTLHLFFIYIYSDLHLIHPRVLTSLIFSASSHASPSPPFIHSSLTPLPTLICPQWSQTSTVFLISLAPLLLSSSLLVSLPSYEYPSSLLVPCSTPLCLSITPKGSTEGRPGCYL